MSRELTSFQGWTFYDFVDHRGRNVVEEWLNSIPSKAKQKINIRLGTMRNLEIWPETYAKLYKGVRGLMELRIRYQNVQYRPLGWFGPRRHEFTILAGAIEKGWRIPPGEIETATNRLATFLEFGREVIREHQYD